VEGLKFLDGTQRAALATENYLNLCAAECPEPGDPKPSSPGARKIAMVRNKSRLKLWSGFRFQGFVLIHDIISKNFSQGGQALPIDELLSSLRASELSLK